MRHTCGGRPLSTCRMRWRRSRAPTDRPSVSISRPRRWPPLGRRASPPPRPPRHRESCRRPHQPRTRQQPPPPRPRRRRADRCLLINWAGPDASTRGNPVSLDFQGADLRAVLRTFSEISGLNIVIDPAVQGTVDVVLKDVPWDQALDLILRSNKLGYLVDGTIVRIAPLSVLADEEGLRRKLSDEQALAGELRVLTRTLSYARAEELQNLLTRSALSPRGTVQIDPRTNTLIITDWQTVSTLPPSDHHPGQGAAPGRNRGAYRSNEPEYARRSACSGVQRKS